MAVKIAVDFPDMEKGVELDIGGVLVKNKSSVDLDEEQEQAFVGRHRKAVKDWAGDSPYVKVTGSPKFSTKQVEEMYPQPETAQPELDDVVVAPAEPAEEEGSKS